MKRKTFDSRPAPAPTRKIPVIKPPEQLMRDLVHAARVSLMPDSLIKEGSKQFYLQISHFRKAICLPAAILAQMGANLPWDRYQELVLKVIHDAKIHAIGEIRFPGGYLRGCMQKYMQHHKNEWYEIAKGIRHQAYAELNRTGQAQVRDLTVEILAQASALISTKRPKKPAPAKPSAETQMGLF